MLRICLVDEEAEFLALMKELIGNCLARKTVLCEIDIYQNPELLYWEFLEKREYDICFLDIEMPQMDGRELAERICVSAV
ncbi:MAG TPA: response regulator [Candidatus Eisenbergiella intestinipullorum]|nr:response regulator [Candidatus Eisenbergiella intestinipullorum]